MVVKLYSLLLPQYIYHTHIIRADLNTFVAIIYPMSPAKVSQNTKTCCSMDKLPIPDITEMLTHVNTSITVIYPIPDIGLPLTLPYLANNVPK
jgi:hypothetical protein